jgi:predicted hotdog family 3-hydroxylacyl-ACP dehydratase
MPYIDNLENCLKKMIPADFDILELIPQRYPMIMIDALITADEKSARGKLHILESNLFIENGVLAEPGLIEFIAQTAAAYTGFKNKTASKEVSEGYIGAIKNLVIYELPRINSNIESEIVVENEIVGYTIIAGRVFHDDKLMAECEMRILGK